MSIVALSLDGRNVVASIVFGSYSVRYNI
jgi:hypothetical protein